LSYFEYFEVKRKLDRFSFIEDFFEYHSSATEYKKDKKRTKNSNFLTTKKYLNELTQ